MTRRTAWRVGLALAILPVALALVLVALWRIDASRPGRVGRNVTLAGEPIGGATRSEVGRIVMRLAARYAQAEVRIVAPDGGFVTDAGAVDLRLEEQRTVQAALSVGNTGPGLRRFGSWMGSFLRARAVDVQISFDDAAVYPLVSEQDPGPRSEPREPSIEYSDGELQAVPGRPGKGIDAHEVIAELPRAADRGLPIVVEVDRGVVYPRFAEEQAGDLARRGEVLTAGGLRVQAGGQETRIPPERLRAWLGSRVTASGLELRVRTETALEELKELLPELEREPVDAAFAVEGEQVSIAPGEPGLGCCAPEAARRIERALRGRTRGQVQLPLVEIPPETTEQDLDELGITRQVSTFTTNHASGQNRVENIHRIADLIRGQIIGPGETFSVNEFVGPRTREKGFVVDGVIENGRFTESVGGGISQFATTLFNAAFFAGLDFPEYQSHSIYISRYPYGREATLSYPQPDLEIANHSPNSVLIWPTYTDSSITVSLYSSPWVEVEQSAQSSMARGPCTLVRTERTRTSLVDGTSETDRIIALYRPAEGVSCR